MSLLKPFSHDVLKETVMSLPQHRVTLVSRSVLAARDAVEFIRSSDTAEKRHTVAKIFRNKYTGLIEQKQGEWPTEATMNQETPALVNPQEPAAQTILDGPVEIDHLLLDSMASELQKEDAGVGRLNDIRAAVGQAAVSVDDAQARLIRASTPEGEGNERLPKAA